MVSQLSLFSSNTLLIPVDRRCYKNIPYKQLSLTIGSSKDLFGTSLFIYLFLNTAYLIELVALHTLFFIAYGKSGSCGGSEVLQRCFANLFAPRLFLVLLNCILQIDGRNENRANIQVPAQGGWLSLLRQCKQLGEAVPSCTRWSIGGTTPQDKGQPCSEPGSGSEGSKCAFLQSFLSLCHPHFSSRRVSLENPTSCKSGGFHLFSFADQIILHSLCSDT